MDGSVEAMLQGGPERVDALCAWLRDGDTPGLVDRIDIEPIEPPFPRFDRFQHADECERP
jgi:acylphosphatase